MLDFGKSNRDSKGLRHSEKNQVLFFPIQHAWVHCHIPSLSLSLLLLDEMSAYFATRDIWQYLETLLAVTLVDGPTGIQCVAVRDAAKQPITHRTTRYDEEISDPTCQ